MALHPLQVVFWVAATVGVGLLATPWRDVGYPLLAAAFFGGFVLFLTSDKKSFLRRPVLSLSHFFVAGLLAALAALVSSWGNVLLASTVLVVTGILVGRYALLVQLRHTRHLWFEPALAALAIVLWVLGNLYGEGGLAGWLAPVPFVVFGVVSLGPMTARGLAMKRAAEHAAPVGREAPGFSLQNHAGRKVELGDYRGKPLLVLFVRGDWCPACHIMLRTYQRRRAELAAKGIVVVAIGPDPEGINRQMTETLGLEYELLSDPMLETARRYGVMLQRPKKYASGLPLPAAFLVDGDGVIRFTSHSANGGELLEPEALFPVVAALKPAAVA